MRGPRLFLHPWNVLFSLEITLIGLSPRSSEEKIIRRVRQLVAHKFEEHRLAWRSKAKKERLAALQQVQNIKPDLTSLELIRNKINELLRLPHGEKAGLQLQAYHRKLETVTENDLKGILKDLEYLKLLDDSSSKTD